jgi:hypothetical protein
MKSDAATCLLLFASLEPMLSFGFDGFCKVVGPECIDQAADHFVVLLINAEKQANCAGLVREFFE